MPIYWTSRAVIHLLVLTVETTAFTTRKAVYYTVGTRVSLSAGISTVHVKCTKGSAVFCYCCHPWLSDNAAVTAVRESVCSCD